MDQRNCRSHTNLLLCLPFIQVETEQIVCDTAESALSRSRVSSVVQIRGSVPLFWSQDTTGIVVVGKPPLAITVRSPASKTQNASCFVEPYDARHTIQAINCLLSADV